MIIIDSVVWIAYKNKRDFWHDQAVKLLTKILKQEKIVYVTDYIILEVINFLNRKTNQKTAVETLEMFTKSEKIRILYNDSVTFLASKNIMMKYSGLSLTDANIIVNMKDYEINQLCSLDQGFNGVKGIKLVN
jgi:predicted nucleic acid-binding protein